MDLIFSLHVTSARNCVDLCAFDILPLSLNCTQWCGFGIFDSFRYGPCYGSRSFRSLFPPSHWHHWLEGWSAGTGFVNLSSGAMLLLETHTNVIVSLAVNLLSFIRASSAAILCYNPLTQLANYQSFLLFSLILLFSYFLE